MPPDKNLPELKAAAAYADHRARHVPLLQAFERGLKLINELYERVERVLFAGLAYTQAVPDKKTVDMITALSRALSQAGAVHARLLEQEAAAAEAMSEAEKIKFVTAMLKTKPLSIRQAVAAEIMQP